MGFFDDVGSFLGDVTGQTQSKKGYNAFDLGEAAAGTATKKTGTQFAQEAGAAGQQLGNQMGKDAATIGAQEAAQSARASGLNKGQAALMGTQQTGRLFTQGQQAGQLAGMNAYGQGAENQLNAANTEINAGMAMKGAGAQAGQNTMSGIGKLAGAAIGFAKGGIVDKPTNAVVGESGPEAVLPLNDKERMAQILEKLGLRNGAAEVRAMKCPTCGQEMKQAKSPEAKKNG